MHNWIVLKQLIKLNRNLDSIKMRAMYVKIIFLMFVFAFSFSAINSKANLTIIDNNSVFLIEAIPLCNSKYYSTQQLLSDINK
jgi:hypothetical protein